MAMSESGPTSRYRANLRGEVDSAALYHALAQAEKDPHLAEVYRRVAAIEEAHAEFWKKQLGRVGARVGRLRLGWRARALAWLARRFAGGSAAGNRLLLTGLGGLVAGACSMAMGEWLSVTSSRELNQQQIDIEADELKRMPEEEKEEMTLIYQAKGLSQDQARALADRLMANKDSALDTLVREELGIDPDELGGSPWAAAASSFGLFSAGALFSGGPLFLVRWPPEPPARPCAQRARLGPGAVR